MLAMGCVCCGSLAIAGLVPHSAHADGGAVFSYGEESGPLSWGGTCSAGQQQSPIDLPRLTPASACSLQPPIFRYQADRAVQVKNTGTTIQLNFEPGSQSARWGDVQLELLQLHFHTPSEHAIAGQRLAMEAHLVHRNAATGGLAVIAVMLQPPEQDSSSSSSSSSPGGNPCLAAALQHVPPQPKAETACPVAVDPSQLLPTGPAAQQYIHYRGSLTTPPCSEGVDWLVWQQPLPVTDQQVLAFMRFTSGGASYGHNARPLQPNNGRALEPDCLAAS